MNFDYKTALLKINALVKHRDPEIALKAAALIVRENIPVKIDFQPMKTLEDVDVNMDKVIEQAYIGEISQKQCQMWIDILDSKRVSLFDILHKNRLESLKKESKNN